MEKLVYQDSIAKSAPAWGPKTGTSNLPVVLPKGCINKKWLYYLLRPDSMAYRAKVVRDFMFTADRLSRCGITPEQYPRIRVFTAEASATIVADLCKLNLI
jgi:hypothetical protein